MLIDLVYYLLANYQYHLINQINFILNLYPFCQQNFVKSVFNKLGYLSISFVGHNVFLYNSNTM